MGKKTRTFILLAAIVVIGFSLPNVPSDVVTTRETPIAPSTFVVQSESQKIEPTQSAPAVTESESSKPEPKPSATASPASEPTSLQELILQLVIAPEFPDGYDRDLFRHWIDVDGNGCNTRREVLIAEAKVKPTVTGDCDLVGGEWYSVYDQVSTTDPSSFDIDHFIPLKEAWDSGAYAWSSDKRKDFANDLGFDKSLIAVTASSNRSKSDRDPSDWMPANTTYHCSYITSWVEVKIRWGLTVDEVELGTLNQYGKSCD